MQLCALQGSSLPQSGATAGHAGTCTVRGNPMRVALSQPLPRLRYTMRKVPPLSMTTQSIQVCLVLWGSRAVQVFVLVYEVFNEPGVSFLVTQFPWTLQRGSLPCRLRAQLVPRVCGTGTGNPGRAGRCRPHS